MWLFSGEETGISLKIRFFGLSVRASRGKTPQDGARASRTGRKGKSGERRTRKAGATGEDPSARGGRVKKATGRGGKEEKGGEGEREGRGSSRVCCGCRGEFLSAPPTHPPTHLRTRYYLNPLLLSVPQIKFSSKRTLNLKRPCTA